MRKFLRFGQEHFYYTVPETSVTFDDRQRASTDADINRKEKIEQQSEREREREREKIDKENEIEHGNKGGNFIKKYKDYGDKTERK